MSTINPVSAKTGATPVAPASTQKKASTKTSPSPSSTASNSQQAKPSGQTAPSGSSSTASSSSSSSSTASTSTAPSTASTSTTVALSDGTLETITVNSDGSQTITYSDPSNPPQGVSSDILLKALADQAARKATGFPNPAQEGGFAFISALATLPNPTVNSGLNLTGSTAPQS